MSQDSPSDVSHAPFLFALLIVAFALVGSCAVIGEGCKDEPCDPVQRIKLEHRVGRIAGRMNVSVTAPMPPAIAQQTMLRLGECKGKKDTVGNEYVLVECEHLFSAVLTDQECAP